MRKLFGVISVLQKEWQLISDSSEAQYPSDIRNFVGVPPTFHFLRFPFLPGILTLRLLHRQCLLGALALFFSSVAH